LSQIQDWAEVTPRGVASLVGLALASLMVWGFGFAVVKGAVVALSSLAGPTMPGLNSLNGAKFLWALTEGFAFGLLVVLLRRGWLAVRRRSLDFDQHRRVVPQAAPSLMAGLAVGLMTLALNVGALPTVMESRGEIDLSTGIPALLTSAHVLSSVPSDGGGTGGGDPDLDIHRGWGALLALLVVLVIAGILVGGVMGGGLGAMGLGALSGATEGAVSGGGPSERTGAIASAVSGAASGAFVGILGAAISIHLTWVFAGATGKSWGPVIGFDMMATVFATLLTLLCRPTRDNPTGLIGNTSEAGKFMIVLVQYALLLAIVGVLLAGVASLLQWIFD